MPQQPPPSSSDLIPVAVAAAGPLDADDVESAPDRWGRYKRPTPWALNTIDWAAEGFSPRWLGRESGDCAVSFDPSIFANYGADELQRFTEGVRSRSDVGIVIWTVGLNDNPDLTGYSNVFGGGDSVLTPGDGNVSCRRLPLGVQPALADDLMPADRDLAMRLRNNPGIARWWALDLQGWHTQGPGGTTMVSPSPGRLVPLLQDNTGATLAGVAEVDGQRWYFLPRGVKPIGLLRWLMQQAFPTWAPDALRAARRSVAIDKQLQTSTEHSLRAELTELETNYVRRREALEAELTRATADADTVRVGLLYGRGSELEDAVARAFRAAGLRVQSLDDLLGDTQSADLLVEHEGRRWLVEIKSANGAASESLVADIERHQQTWPQLRSDLPIAGGVLVVNHHLAVTPEKRPVDIYKRPEFVGSLTVPVINTRAIFDLWRDQDAAALRAIFV